MGMARSGQSATAALARQGVDVVVADRKLGGDDDPALLDGVELVVKIRRSGRARARGEGPCRRRSRVERGRARLPAAAAGRFVGVTGTNGKTTTVELLGDLPRGRPAGRRRRQRGAAVDLGGTRGLGRLRALLLSARGRPRAVVRNRGALEPRAGPSRPPRHVRRVPRREAPHLRAGADGGRASRPRAGHRVLPRRPAACRAANARRAQPRNAAAATAASRAAGIRDDAIARALESFPASSTGWSTSRKSVASDT